MVIHTNILYAQPWSYILNTDMYNHGYTYQNPYYISEFVLYNQGYMYLISVYLTMAIYTIKSRGYGTIEVSSITINFQNILLVLEEPLVRSISKFGCMVA